MFLKILATTLFVSGAVLSLTGTADARGRRCSSCCTPAYACGSVPSNTGAAPTNTGTAQMNAGVDQSTDVRRYSYEPQYQPSMSRGNYSRSRVPTYLLPKTDPRRYD